MKQLITIIFSLLLTVNTVHANILDDIRKEMKDQQHVDRYEEQHQKYFQLQLEQLQQKHLQLEITQIKMERGY